MKRIQPLCTTADHQLVRRLPAGWLLISCALALAGCSQPTPAPTPGEVALPLADKPAIQPENWPRQPSPIARDDAIEQRIDALLAQMTPQQKVGQIIQADIASVTPQQVREYYLGSVLNGGNSAPGRNNRAGAGAWLDLADQFWVASTDTSDGRPFIPVFWGTDAVHGHSNVKGATIFPHNIGLGAMHEPSLLRDIGRITATEMQVTGLDWTFAPTIAVARDDRWGRTYESYSENPALVADYAPQILMGIQGVPGSDSFLHGEHMLATVKHFLGDGGTQLGKDQGDNQDSEAGLRDIHGKPYYAAIAAGARAVMASYNSWHGDKMHGFEPMLNQVLVGRMGFNGFTVGDWNGHGQVQGCTPTDCAAAFNAGLDMFMAPDSWQALYHNTLAQVQDGRISQQRLDQAVSRILRIKMEMGLFEQVRPSQRPLAGRWELLGAPRHRTVAREAARKSLVLLKNNNNVLPLAANSRVLVAGDGADNIGKQAGGWTLSWQGTGNANSDFPNGESIYAGIKQAIEAGGGSVELNDNGQYRRKPDVAVVVFGEEPYAEFIGDRPHLAFDDNRALQILTELRAQGIPTVSVFLSGRPLWVNPELNQSDAFVAAFLPGTEGGAIADLLIRAPDGSIRHDFQGRLSFSWPDDATGEPLNLDDADYSPLFAYGYGLSYEDKISVPPLSETSGLAPEQVLNTSRYLYAGKAVRPWQLQLIDDGRITLVQDALQESSNGALVAQATDRRQQEDSVLVSFKQNATLALAHGEDLGVDLARLAEGDMALEMEYRLVEGAGTPVLLGMACGADCGTKLDFTEYFAGRQDSGWQTLKVPLRCFTGMDMSRVNRPLVIQGSAGLTLQLASIRLANSEGQGQCGE